MEIELKTILIIDDEEDDRLKLRSFLHQLGYSRDGYEVWEASGAREGFELFEKHNPDCIILDFMMYGKDGFQMLTELRGMRRKMPPVIFITGMHSSLVEEDALALGATCYVDKNQMDVDALSGALQIVARTSRNNG
jgi:CheY-like chemotaxis protein